MKNFFGSLLGALLGVALVGIVIVILFVSGLSSMFKGSPATTEVSPGSVLHLRLDMPITEREPLSSFPALSSFQNDRSIGLNLLLAQIKKAKTDDKIKGIYLEASDVNAGMATVEDLRVALLDFRSSKKFVISYSEYYTQKGYYLASAANRVLVHPEGGIELKGLSAQLTFYKKMLEKLEIDVQIFRHGKFKSAVEPFDLEKMSDANRLQTGTYVNALWQQMVSGIASERKIDKTRLNELADQLLIRNSADAVEANLADATVYQDEAWAEVCTKAGSNSPNLVTPQNYQYAASTTNEDSEDDDITNRIAVVYAVGSIESGEGDDATIGSARIAKAIRSAADDQSVKAIVLRVNSPGGSALASDVIWREVVLAKQKKPVVVSMGDVAASGGYYIACAATRILAQPNTITGSIGVFGLLPNLKNMLENKIGLTHDTVNSNTHADFGTTLRAVDTLERQVMQEGVEAVYVTFITRVAEGRNMTVAEVDSLGQGRVWSGTDAKRLGLVDELGGLTQAIAVAADLAKIGKNYRIQSLPAQKSPFEDFLKGNSTDARIARLEQELGVLSAEYIQFRRSRLLLQLKGVQARMPFDVDIR